MAVCWNRRFLIRGWEDAKEGSAMKLHLCRHCEQPLMATSSVCPRCEMPTAQVYGLRWLLTATSSLMGFRRAAAR